VCPVRRAGAHPGGAPGAARGRATSVRAAVGRRASWTARSGRTGPRPTGVRRAPVRRPAGRSGASPGPGPGFRRRAGRGDRKRRPGRADRIACRDRAAGAHRAGPGDRRRPGRAGRTMPPGHGTYRHDRRAGGGVRTTRRGRGTRHRGDRRRPAGGVRTRLRGCGTRRHGDRDGRRAGRGGRTTRPARGVVTAGDRRDRRDPHRHAIRRAATTGGGRPPRAKVQGRRPSRARSVHGSPAGRRIDRSACQAAAVGKRSEWILHEYGRRLPGIKSPAASLALRSSKTTHAEVPAAYHRYASSPFVLSVPRSEVGANGRLTVTHRGDDMTASDL
jgi:hypothetical protein